MSLNHDYIDVTIHEYRSYISPVRYSGTVFIYWTGTVDRYGTFDQNGSVYRFIRYFPVPVLMYMMV